MPVRPDLPGLQDQIAMRLRLGLQDRPVLLQSKVTRPLQDRPVRQGPTLIVAAKVNTAAKARAVVATKASPATIPVVPTSTTVNVW